MSLVITRSDQADPFVIQRDACCLGIASVAVGLTITTTYGIIRGIARLGLGGALTDFFATPTRALFKETHLWRTALAAVFGGADLAAIQLGAGDLAFGTSAVVATIGRCEGCSIVVRLSVVLADPTSHQGTHDFALATGAGVAAVCRCKSFPFAVLFAVVITNRNTKDAPAVAARQQCAYQHRSKHQKEIFLQESLPCVSRLFRLIM